jgi:alkanesulfonate monooxygenase SsuD/methylene tetrahydromethanopterin reductase-like flavin-dependent oxidoreductase (luciferase family)
MDCGICLPNFPDGASREGMEAGAEVAERLGWSTVWTTDHVLVPTADAGDYGRIYEAILSLAWIGAKYSKVRLGTSLIVVPMRNAVVLAKELATLDSLSGGRVLAGVGVGWNEREFRERGGRGPVPRARRVLGRDDPAVATSLVGLDRAVPRSVPRPRRLRLRAPARSGR